MTKTGLSTEQFEELVYAFYHEMLDLYLPSDSYLRFMINSYMECAFCEKNKEAIIESVIVMKALSIIMKKFGFVYYYGVDEWIEHFGPEVVKYLYSQINK